MDQRKPMFHTKGDWPRLICLIGAECTGKTTLAKELACEFDGLLVPEALRDFCDRHGRTPQQHEQAALIDAQVALEEKALAQAARQGARWVFCDTAPLLITVYSDHYFGDTSLYPRAQALHTRYALTLWLQPDLPWVADGHLRDGQGVQQRVHALLQQHLTGVPMVLIGGQGAARLQMASTAIAAVPQAA